ncbi:amino acid ABC transporter permease [Alkalihalobacterium bogoriense]|uniref:amino acid ABC transporter permease n=1 Tax=Alkalihalobacterium bogoriense TaxID=246272 RepID=UPI000552FC15|nr:amino acid ABC transporter permease [Alkalihalobacterium bogoriense]
MILERNLKTVEVKTRPVVKVGFITWIKKNLFSSWLNGMITLLLAAIIISMAIPAFRWIFVSGNWTVIEANFKLVVVGQYPIDQLWRVWTCFLFVSGLLGVSYGRFNGKVSKLLFYSIIGLTTINLLLPFITMQSRLWLICSLSTTIFSYLISRKYKSTTRIIWVGWFLVFPIGIFLLHGFGVLPVVGTNVWGGFLLTLLISLVAIVVSFPIGVLLALGRASQLPIIRWLCIVYIEVIRGVPLITILFMSSIMLPLFLPAGISIDSVVRAMVAFTLFNAAYIAENVRGGLQSIPKSQYEASTALGLNTIQMTAFIILPQALRVTVPSMVGQSISIFKDTTLVAVIGMVDLLGIARAVIANPQFLGTQKEVYLFVAFVFWIFCFVMSRASKEIENNMNKSYR